MTAEMTPDLRLRLSDVQQPVPSSACLMPHSYPYRMSKESVLFECILQVLELRQTWNIRARLKNRRKKASTV
eukprot:scaffold343389_cov31-Prasinocladus_malaysianus.AAC.1